MKQSLPTIPMSEYPKRWEKIWALMDRNQLDYLLIYADDHAVSGPAYARWLANFHVHFEPVLILFRPQKEPILLVGPESLDYARLHTPIKDIRILTELYHPDEDYIFTPSESFAHILAEIPCPRFSPRIGIGGYNLIPYLLAKDLQQALPKAEWLDMDQDLGMLRSSKSPAEIQVITYAYQIAQAGLEAAISAIKPGITERQIAAEAEYAMRQMGAEGTGIDTFVASGKHSSPIIARTTTKTIANDDLVLLTLAPRYEGYHAAVALPVTVGKVADNIKHAINFAIEAQENCHRLLKAGAGAEVEKSARDIMQKAGLEKHFLYSGIHSVGVIEFEAPIFGPSYKGKMEKDMILSVDIPVFGCEWGGFRIEDGYLIQAEDAKRLTSIDYQVAK